MKRKSRSAAFTLLELLVVMAILAIVTALAVRSLDGVQDQRRHEAAQRGLEEIEFAVLGSPDDRAADGSRTISGFVADMGRLPRTNLPAGATFVELRELWENPGFAFDVRAAIVANGVPLADEDTQVLVPGGWRGPYLRLPLGNAGLLDAYGNAVTSPTDSSPANPDTTGYARLRDAVDAPITAVAQDVRIVRILGANGRRDTADTGYDRDEALASSDDKFRAALTGNVEVLDSSSSPATPDGSRARTRSRCSRRAGERGSQIAVVRTTVTFTAPTCPWLSRTRAPCPSISPTA